MDCHACKAENSYQQYHWGNHGPIMDTFQCKNCKHIFRNYKGDVEEYHREKYRSSGEEGHKMYPKEERLKYISTILECIKPHMEKDMSVLEIGSGDGLFATKVKDYVGKVICSDIDAKMANKCKKLGFESMAINVLELDDDKKFDIIFGFDVLEHVLDIQEFKEKMNKIVDQYLVLQVPVDRTMVPPNNYDRGAADPFDGHTHYFSPDSIVSLFKEYFEHVKVFYARPGKLARGSELLCVFKKRKEINTYREHYEKSRKTSNVTPEPGSKYKSLYDVSVDKTFLDLDERYYELVSKISEKIKYKLDNESETCHDVGFATYVNDWRDISEISKLADIIMPQIEEKIFHSNLKVEFVMPYRNGLTNEKLQASWVWHYDDCPKEYLKLVIYLNETSENSGCFQYISCDKQIPIIPSSRFAPGAAGQQYFPGSRIPDQYVENLLSNECEISSLTGPQGTYALFTPNIIHRATIPKKTSTPREALFFFIRPSLKKENYINENTNSVLPEKDVKRYKLD